MNEVPTVAAASSALLKLFKGKRNSKSIADNVRAVSGALTVVSRVGLTMRYLRGSADARTEPLYYQ